FLTSISEAYVRPFERGKIGDSQLIDFGVRHIIADDDGKLVKQTSDGRGSIAARFVDSAAKRYFGISIRGHKSVGDFQYRAGSYHFAITAGEAITFSKVH